MKTRAPFLALAATIAITLMALASIACGEALQGERIAFVSFRDGNSEIYAMNPDGSAARRLTKHHAIDREPAWSPDGRRIAFESNRDGRWGIFAIDADGSDVTRLTNNDANDWDFAWSPDGQRIAFISDRDADRSKLPMMSEIYSMNADGTETARLTDNDFEDDEPAWSPDGQRIAFVSERDGNADIYAMNADGSKITRLTNHEAADFQPVWSPDGRRIAFVSIRDADMSYFPPASAIYSMNADGSDLTRLTNNELVDWNPIWSPDGLRIAFSASHGHARSSIYVMNADGSDAVGLSDGHSHVWSPDGQRIAFANYPGVGRMIEGDNEIYVMNADGSEITQITDNDRYDMPLSWVPAP